MTENIGKDKQLEEGDQVKVLDFDEFPVIGIIKKVDRTLEPPMLKILIGSTMHETTTDEVELVK